MSSEINKDLNLNKVELGKKLPPPKPELAQEPEAAKVDSSEKKLHDKPAMPGHTAKNLNLSETQKVVGEIIKSPEVQEAWSNISNTSEVKSLSQNQQINQEWQTHTNAKVAQFA